MDEKRKKWLWITLTVITVSGLATGKGIRSYYLRRQEYNKVEDLYQQSQRRVQLKQWKLARAAKDDVFLEREARRQLGLVGDGEIEFRWNPAPAVKTEMMPSDKIETKK